MPKKVIIDLTDNDNSNTNQSDKEKTQTRLSKVTKPKKPIKKKKLKSRPQFKKKQPNRQRNQKPNITLSIDSREVELINLIKKEYENTEYENMIKTKNNNIKYGDINIIVDNKVECIVERKNVNDLISNWSHYLEQEQKVIKKREITKRRISTILVIEGDLKTTRQYGKFDIKKRAIKHLENLYTKTRIEKKETKNLIETKNEICKLFKLYLEKGSISKQIIFTIDNTPEHFTKKEYNFTIDSLNNIMGLSLMGAYNINTKFGSLSNIALYIRKNKNPNMFKGIRKSEQTSIGNILSVKIYEQLKKHLVE